MSSEKEIQQLEKELIKEFQEFRKKYTMTCNSIQLYEVAQFVLYKEGSI